MLKSSAHLALEISGNRSTLHWFLVISGAGHQGQLECSGRLRLQLLKEDRNAPQVLLRPKKRQQFEIFDSSRRGSKGQRLNALSTGETEDG